VAARDDGNDTSLRDELDDIRAMVDREQRDPRDRGSCEIAAPDASDDTVFWRTVVTVEWSGRRAGV